MERKELVTVPTVPTHCILTGINIVDGTYGESMDEVYYQIRLWDDNQHITVCHTCYSKMKKGAEFKKLQPMIRSLLVNKKISIHGSRFHWDGEGYKEGKDARGFINVDLQTAVRQAIYPKNPKEKFEHVYKTFYEYQTKDGEELSFSDLNKDTELLSKLYMVDAAEAVFYLKALHQSGIIELNGKINHYTPSFQFTIKGLLDYITLFEEGYNSKFCFIAMNFDASMKETRETIKRAVERTGFQAYVVDEQHLKSDQTINDAIISGLKQSKFCIADFCGHKMGVYFEAGFAVGQGKPVIYTCTHEEFKKAHFDLKPLQHILYNDLRELEEALVVKIEAWIK